MIIFKFITDRNKAKPKRFVQAYKIVAKKQSNNKYITIGSFDKTTRILIIDLYTTIKLLITPNGKNFLKKTTEKFYIDKLVGSTFNKNIKIKY